MSSKLNELCDYLVKEVVSKTVPPGQSLPDDSFGYFLFLLKQRGRRSGLLKYYRMARHAFRNPGQARRTLQHMLCNYSSFLEESSVFAYEMLGNAPADSPISITSANGGEVEMIKMGLIEEVVYENGGKYSLKGLEKEPLAMIDAAAGRVGLASLLKTFDKLKGYPYFSVAFALRSLRNRAFRDTVRQAYGGISDMGHLGAVLLAFTTLVESRNKMSVSALADIFRLRNSMIHNDALLRPTLVYQYQQKQMNKIDAMYSECSDETRAALYYICSLAMLPFAIYCGEVLTRGKKLKNELSGLRLWVRISSLFSANRKDYGQIWPLEEYYPNERHKKGRKRRSDDFIGSLGVLAIVFFFVVVPFRGCVNWMRENRIQNSSDKAIERYVSNKTKYDDALLFKERKKTVAANPELANPAREQELTQRAIEQGWPTTAWYKTLWHIGTPAFLHTNMVTPAGDYLPQEYQQVLNDNSKKSK